MARQSISISEPNDEWLKSRVDSKEYASKRELVNDLICQARKQQEHLARIRLKLEQAEQSGFTTDSKEDIRIIAQSLTNGLCPATSPKTTKKNLTQISHGRRQRCG